jgi:hypothetical protein
MKRLIPIFLFLLFLTNCEKERRTCWDCTTITIFDYLYNPALDSYDVEKIVICDHTESEIREYEDINTFNSEYRDGIEAYHYDLKSTCYCIK